MTQVNSELQDVTRIMVANIEDVIHRGEALNSKFDFSILLIFGLNYYPHTHMLTFPNQNQILVLS